MLLATWNITFFGGLRVDNGSTVSTRFKTGKTGELLAYLAFSTQAVHRREELAHRLWPDAATPAALSSLRTALASLRKQLETTTSDGPLILPSSSNIRLNRAAVETDVVAFEKEIQAAVSGTQPEPISCLSRAVEIYRGEFLSGYNSDWVESERQRYVALYLHARHQLVCLLENAGQGEQALFHAQHLVKADPGNETIHHTLMRLYANCGDSPAALRQYRTLRRVLRAESRSIPSPVVTELARRIQRSPDDSSRITPPAGTAAITIQQKTELPREYSFPIPVTPFFGREAEISRIVGLFRGTFRAHSDGIALITLTGIGGLGKTRLAMEIANRFREEFQAVYFVPLASATTRDHIVTALLQVLREHSTIPLQGMEQVVAALRRRSRTLLILDNFEQLLPTLETQIDAEESGAALVHMLLQQVPGLHCLITSRRPLEIDGEQAIMLHPLPVPAAEWETERIRDSPSVRLFVERARARVVDFTVTARNAAIIATICTELEGLPLAIELAAARVYCVPPSEMLELLRNQLDFLAKTGRPDSGRHSTLRNTIAWSYRLLSPEQQMLFARLSVFHGWSSEDAHAIIRSPGIEGGIDELCDHSLILRDAEGRYRMLEVVREYAREQLADAEKAEYRKRHAEHFLSLARQAIMATREKDQAEWLNRLEASEPNLRAALQDSLGSEIGLRLTGALHHFWYVRGRLREGSLWMRQALVAMPDASDDLRSSMLNALGVFCGAQGEYAEADRLLSESMRIREKSGDRAAVAALRNNLGTNAHQRGDLSTARDHLEVSIQLHRDLERFEQVAHALNNLASVAIDQGETEEALRCIAKSLEISRDRDDHLCIANSRHLQGVISHARDDIEDAEQRFIACLDMRQMLKDQRFLPGLLVWFGTIAVRRGNMTRAAHLFGAATRLRDAINASLAPADARVLTNSLNAIKQSLPPAIFELAWEEGAGMTTEQSLIYARNGVSLS